MKTNLFLKKIFTFTFFLILINLFHLSYANSLDSSDYHFQYDGSVSSEGLIHSFDHIDLIKNITASPYYKFSFDLKVSDNQNHELIEINLITGTDGNSTGYRDRLFIENDRIRVIGATAKSGYDNTIYPDFDHWQSMQDLNHFEVVRNQKNITVFVNGDLVYEGFRGKSSIATTQFYVSTNSNLSADFYLYSVTLKDLHENFSVQAFGGNTQRVARVYEASDDYKDLGMQFRFNEDDGRSNHSFQKIDEVQSIISSRHYAINFDLNVDRLEAHDLIELNLITGTNDNHISYRDLIFIEGNQIRFPKLKTISGYPNVISIENTQRHRYRYERMQKIVSFYIDDDDEPVYKGSDGRTHITTPQFYLGRNTSLSANIFLYSLTVSNENETLNIFGDFILPGWSSHLGVSENTVFDSETKTLNIKSNENEECYYKIDAPKFLKEITSDGIYTWELEFNVGENHQFLIFDLISGHLINQNEGYRDRLFVENNRLRIIGPEAIAGFDNIILEGSTNYDFDLNQKNIYKYVRYGDDVALFINGNLAYKGVGGNSDISSSQLFLKCTDSYVTNISLSKIYLKDNQLNPAQNWIQNHDFVIAGTTDKTPLTNADVNFYKDEWHATAADVFSHASNQILDYWDTPGTPWVEWVSPGSELEEGQPNFTQIDPADVNYQIGYHIGGEPKDSELTELLNTAQALKNLNPTALVYGGIQADLSDLYFHDYMKDESIDLVMSHRYNYNDDTYNDLARYRKYGLQYGKPYWRFLCSFQKNPKNPDSTSCHLVEQHESDLRFETFSTLIYGYKGLIWFFYNLHHGTLTNGELPVLFTEPTTYNENFINENENKHVFTTIAQINKEAQHLGNELKSLRSLAVHLNTYDGSTPKNTSAWALENSADPYLTEISQLDDIDVLTGFFMNDETGERYFMIQNTSHAHNKPGGSPDLAMTGTIELTFFFDGNDIVIEKLNKENGNWEFVTLTEDLILELTLNAGDADLFRYHTNMSDL